MGNFSMLPKDIMLDIFTRLPAELTLEIKTVSKTWKKVVEHPSFSKLHFNNQLNKLDCADSGKLSFISLFGYYGAQEFYYVEYDENETPSHRVKKMVFKPPFKDYYSLVGSSNGLFCLNGLPSQSNYDSDQSNFVGSSNGFNIITFDSDQSNYVAYIFNPITGESVTLPELENDYDLVDTLTVGFGYVPSTNEYKVVRMCKFSMREAEFAHIEVYTLGSGKGWRNEGKKIEIGGLGPRGRSSMGAWQHGVFVNGCIYWNLGQGRIVAFDLADEIFVESPECSEFREITDGFWNRCIKLGVLGDCLYAIHYNTESSDVWLLKKQQDESLMSWSKGFSLTNSAPLALTSNATVLCGSDTKLQLYDLKSSSSKLVADIGKPFCVAIPHRNTLRSLAALGEITKTLESRESAIEEAKGRD